MHFKLIYRIMWSKSSLIWRIGVFQWRSLGLFLWSIWDRSFQSIRNVCWWLCVYCWVLKPAISSIALKIKFTLFNLFSFILSQLTLFSSTGMRSLWIILISISRGRVHNRRLISLKRRLFICYISLLRLIKLPNVLI